MRATPLSGAASAPAVALRPARSVAAAARGDARAGTRAPTSMAATNDLRCFVGLGKIDATVRHGGSLSEVRARVQTLPVAKAVGPLGIRGRTTSRPASSSSSSSSSPSSDSAPALREPPPAPVVKVCGVTSASDAEHAASCGAGMIGMIVWPGAKRSVSAPTARAIASAARGAGAEPVGVFVSESAEEIRRTAGELGLRTVQLHGQGSRDALPQLLEGVDEADVSALSIVYVVPVSPEGEAVAALPPPGAVDWLLLDPPGGGTGQTWDWGAAAALAAKAAPKRGWLVAGGLGPHNVRDAVRSARPNGVDASSGVAGSDGLAKDRVKVEGYVQGGVEALREIWGV